MLQCMISKNTNSIQRNRKTERKRERTIDVYLQNSPFALWLWKKTTAKILREKKKNNITCTEEPYAQMPENKRERARTFFVVFFVHELMCTQCIKGKNSYRFKKKISYFFCSFINFICHRTEYITCKCGTYAQMENREKRKRSTHTHTLTSRHVFVHDQSGAL